MGSLVALLLIVISAVSWSAPAASWAVSGDRQTVQIRFGPSAGLFAFLRNEHRGRTAVVRLDGSGRLARRFAGDGVLGPLDSTAPSFGTVAPDGRILLELRQGKEFFLRRYLANGRVDRSFGDGTGATVIPSHPSLSSPDSIRVFVGPRGGILVTYHTTQTQCYPGEPGGVCDQAAEYLKVHRYSEAGKLLGKRAFYSEYWEFGDAAQTPAGGLVVAGTYQEGGTTVLRLTPSLSPASGFGEREGSLFLHQSEDEMEGGDYFPPIRAVAPAPHRAIVIAPRNGGAVRRYRADGTLDPSFGDHGTVKCPVQPDRAVGAITASIRFLRSLPGGAVLAAGGEGECGLARYRYDGSSDPDFGSEGFVDLSARGLPRPESLAVGPAGQIAVAGWDPNRGTTLITLLSPRGHLNLRFGDGGSAALPTLAGERYRNVKRRVSVRSRRGSWARNWCPTPATSAELLGQDRAPQTGSASLDAFRLNF